MNNLGKWSFPKFPRGWWFNFPIVLALINLLFLGWGVVRQITYPYLGIPDVSPRVENVIEEIDNHGPAEGILREGDVILSIDGVPLSQAKAIYRDKQAGDAVEVIVLRDGDEYQFRIILSHPPFRVIVTRIAPLFVALIFWSVSVAIQTFQPADGVASLFYLFCQTSSAILVAGATSAIGVLWVSSLYGFLLWLIGPLAVHLHLHFPQVVNYRHRGLVLFIFYGLAVTGGVLRLIVQELSLASLLPVFSAASQLMLAGSLLLVATLLVYSYRYALNIQTKTKIRLVVLGGVLSSIPLVFVILLPGVLLRHHYLSINYAFLLLGVVPITYGYAIFRHHLLDIERHVNRGVTYLLVFSILGSAYLILFALALRGWLPHPLAENPFLNALIMLILASTFVPLRRRIQKIVDSAFYGGWYDYRSAVSRILQGIERITELQILANTICQRLCDILHLENAYAFLSDTSGHLSVASAAYSNHQHVQLLPELTLSNDSPLPQYLKGMGKPIAETVLRADLSTATLSVGEKQLLDYPNGRLYLGIISHDELFGILGLGAKIGGDIFNYEDLDILRIVAQQMGPLIQNIHLLTRLKQHAAELEKHVEQRTAELHAEKDRAEAILSSVGEGVIVTDLHGDILTVNHEFEFQTGYTADEAIGNSLFSLMGSDEPQSRGIPAGILQVLEKGGIWRGERLNQRKDSIPYHVHLTIAQIHARSGQVIGYVASQRDITEYKKFDRLKDQFILEISHQLRTPLTNISLLTDLLERGKAHKREDYMLMLKAEIGQLVVMIEQVLELSRLEIGKYRKEDFGRLDVNLVTDQAISAYHSIAQASGLQLIFERGENIPPLWGGPQLLDRMVEGLISNAINFTPSGTVHIRTYKCENQVCLEIQDTGLGIDPADLPHLFDRFYRGRNVDRSRQKGAGLGLCIVREIVNIHNGRIEVESEKDKGTTFRIWLPAMNASRDLSASIKV